MSLLGKLELSKILFFITLVFSLGTPPPPPARLLAVSGGILGSGRGAAGI